jgi:hypothetical protein
MDKDEVVYFQKKIKESFDIFDSWLFPSTYQNFTFNDSALKKAVFLDQLDELNNDNGVYNHNCIPCNLTDGAGLIYQFLQNNTNCESIRYFVTIYSLLLYLQAERFGVIYKDLEYDYLNKKGNKEFNWKSFPELLLVKRWANFFKHPKSSMFIHHSTFHIEGYPKNPNFMFDGIINSDFIEKYYANENSNSELSEKLLNKNFKVFFPDLVEFTKLICGESDKLITIINSKKENVEKLKRFSNNTY